MHDYIQLAAIAALVLIAGYFAWRGYEAKKTVAPTSRPETISPAPSQPASAGQVADLHAAVKGIEAKLETTAAVQDIQKGMQALHQKVDTLHQKIDSIKADTQAKLADKAPEKPAAAA